MSRLVLLIAVLVALAACSSGAEATPTTASPAAPTTSGAPTTTAEPTTTTSTTTTKPTTTTTLASNEVGDAAALHEQIVALLDLMKFNGSIAENVEPYLPDTSNPDPVAALNELWKFENWLISASPNPEWLPLYAYPDSPYEDEAGRFLGTWLLSGFRYLDFSDSYLFQNGRVIDLAEAGLPADLVASVPAGSATVLYESGAGERTRVDVDTGEVVEVLPAWGPTASLAIVSPTATGWKVFASEFDYVP